jgi:transposase
VTTSEARGPQSVVEEVVLGVDTHLEVHVAVVLDRLGRRLGELTVPTTARGYENLISWAESFGIRQRGVRRGGGYRQLRGWAGSPPEEGGNTGG